MRVYAWFSHNQVTARASTSVLARSRSRRVTVGYFESRPVVVDVDGNIEIEGRARVDEETGLMVKLVLRTLGYNPENKAVVDMRFSDWRAFVRAIERSARVELE